MNLSTWVNSRSQLGISPAQLPYLLSATRWCCCNFTFKIQRRAEVGGAHCPYHGACPMGYHLWLLKVHPPAQLPGTPCAQTGSRFSLGTFLRMHSWFRSLFSGLVSGHTLCCSGLTPVSVLRDYSWRRLGHPVGVQGMDPGSAGVEGNKNLLYHCSGTSILLKVSEQIWGQWSICFACVKPWL